MDTHEERKKSEEAKAAVRAKQKFKIEARRNKLLALWAAERMSHADPNAYVADVIASAYGGAGAKDAVTKVFDDLAEAGNPVGEDELRAKTTELMLIAEQQVLDES